jgi:hypothetical protein
VAWAADAILTACCFGETLSRPMLEAIAVVATDPMPEAVARQILRDEHLHATFGWEALGWLMPRLSSNGRDQLIAALPSRYAEFERSTCCGIGIERVAGTELVIERGAANLGTLGDEQYAMIFFATVEQEIIPRLEQLGLPGHQAWADRARSDTIPGASGESGVSKAADGGPHPRCRWSGSHGRRARVRRARFPGASARGNQLRL